MKKQDLIDIAKKNNGYLFYKDLKRKGIPSITLIRHERKGVFKKVSRGIYLLADQIEDPFYIFSKMYSKLVFSHSTALYLQGLSNRQFQGFEATFPHSSRIPSNTELVCHTTRTSNYKLGIQQVKTPYGNEVPCYDTERCICDIFVYEDIEYEDKMFAINQYSKNIDYDKLYAYAKKLKVYDRVHDVFEVVGWK